METQGRFIPGAMSYRRTNGRSLCRRATKTIVPMVILLSVPLSAWPQQNPPDLTTRSMEDLMNVEVTSVSKTEQKLSQTASAVFVISQEDIRRSGATNIPDLLRMVPGVDVAQINASSWAISVRGFNGQYSNEVLVMVDGRSVYTPTFGGVYWDVLDLPLEDIERIEVVRGPGGSIWGANAVNGVINVITKNSADTQGGMAVAGGGNLDQGFGTAEYGGHLGEHADYRVYGKYFNQAALPASDGQYGADSWHVLRSGFRLDAAPSSKDTLAFTGDLYSGLEGSRVNLPSASYSAAEISNAQADVSGGFFQADWKHTDSARSDTALQISFDHYHHDDVITDVRSTLNIDFQHHFAWKDRHNIIWGLGYRFSSEASIGSFALTLDPANLNTQLFNSFIQDEIALVPDKLFLTVGTKLEHNYYTGFSLLPTVRVAWTVNPYNMLWAAFSRAVVTPNSDETATVGNVGGGLGPGGIPILVHVVGNPNFQNETLTAYEMGYRAAVGSRLSVEMAAYYNDYTNLQTVEPTGPPLFETLPPPPHLVVPETFQNLLYAETHGGEVSANFRVTNRWTLNAGYALEQIHAHLRSGSHDATSVAVAQGSSPANSAQLRSRLDLGHGVSWDASAYFVGRLDGEGVPSYTRVDTGVTWQCTKALSFSLVGQNLLRNDHLEFGSAFGFVVPSLIKRSAYAKITWHFQP